MNGNLACFSKNLNTALNSFWVSNVLPRITYRCLLLNFSYRVIENKSMYLSGYTRLILVTTFRKDKQA